MTIVTNETATQITKGQMLKITAFGYGLTKTSQKDRVSIIEILGKRKSKKAVCGYKYKFVVIEGFMVGSGGSIVDFEHETSKIEII